ncbi:MAG: thioredoxin family protein [Chitinophagaceae bacterium]|jgi:small redox-active disulfide protein 2|nr:thioredoxin family protein [Bacteroidota bacterium]MBP9105057.1 thioredoxin family protein [Chitinophagaceae bacterium]MBP9791362.1 thioredoxin family protein [Bacteroidia bacterium]MBK7430324.1 thioredoxin family protein [Bacteroidota bacterium]MBK7573211.1 thioredoxin family protein [Bacteroidota bacterium]
MKRIILFGANCAKCKKTEINLNNVIQKHNLNMIVEKIQDVQEMVKYNILYLPTVMIDNVILFKGIAPSEKEIEKTLTNKLENNL